MRRIKLVLSYDGSNYSGWQRQPDTPTIQQTLETVLRKMTGEDVHLTGSGRTDAGVHALGQVAAFSTKSELEAAVFKRALNGFLPPDIRILDAEEVRPEFHPIRDASSKRYRYLIDDNRPFFPLTRNYAWIYREPLDLEAMQNAAGFLLGEHDFCCFQTQGSPRKTTVRTVFDVDVRRLKNEAGLFPPLICIEVEANGFLYNMMRAIAGSLALIGVEARRGRPDPEHLCRMIASKNRGASGPTAPSHGLYLLRVAYPKDKTEIFESL